MNAELYNIMNEARQALNENRIIDYAQDKYVGKVEFHFLPRKDLFSKKEKVKFSVEEWY